MHTEVIKQRQTAELYELQVQFEKLVRSGCVSAEITHVSGVCVCVCAVNIVCEQE